MVCCLNPICSQPENPDGNKFCQSCGMKLLPLLRSRYRVIQPIGRGGFGRTYLAVDEDRLKAYCVIKQFSPLAEIQTNTTALHKAIQLFEQEAKRLFELGQHPQIPTLFAYFEHDKYLYLVQELIEGQNLHKELSSGGCFNEQLIWELLTNLLPVLQFIHQRQIIHRDIKPENIMRRQSDRALVLIDFGVAKQLTGTVLAVPSTTIGTQGYAPIEQMLGGEVYPASDLYSLGSTCFRLLTGINPFYLWAEHGYSWVTNWRQHLRDEISPELAQVLDKLLQKNIKQRYQSAQEVIQALPTKAATTPQAPPIMQVQLESSLSISTLVSKRYRIIQLLETTGFARLFLAEDTRMPSYRRCVLKQFQFNQSNTQVYQTAVRLFQHEAKILEELSQGCNQLRQLYEYIGQTTPFPQFYLVQEFFEGTNLETKVQQEGTLSENLVKEILMGILPVLDYVHGKRIIHRDVKPWNIILRQRDGLPVLDDFTIATSVNAQSQTDGLSVGTPGFMPPEQMRGQAVYASDIYALGLTAVYLLTGKFPDEIKHLRIDQILGSVSPKLVAVISRAIKKNLGDRYASAQEMLNALLAL